MAYQLSSTRGLLLQRLISDQQNIYRRPRAKGQHASSLVNKENMFNIQRRRKPSTRILRIEFPISKPKREAAHYQNPEATPLVDNTTLNQEIVSLEIDCPTHKPDVLTERPKACWRLRRHHFVQPSQAVLVHTRKRTLGDRQLIKPATSIGIQSQIRSKRLIQNMIKDKIQGWQQSSSSSEVEDCSLPRR